MWTVDARPANIDTTHAHPGVDSEMGTALLRGRWLAEQRHVDGPVWVSPHHHIHGHVAVVAPAAAPPPTEEPLLGVTRPWSGEATDLNLARTAHPQQWAMLH